MERFYGAGLLCCGVYSLYARRPVSTARVSLSDSAVGTVSSVMQIVYAV